MIRCGKQARAEAAAELLLRRLAKAYLERWQRVKAEHTGKDWAPLEIDGEPFCYDPTLGYDEVIHVEHADPS